MGIDKIVLSEPIIDALPLHPPESVLTLLAVLLAKISVL